MEDAGRFQEHHLHAIHTWSITDVRDGKVALSRASGAYGHVVKFL